MPGYSTATCSPQEPQSLNLESRRTRLRCSQQPPSRQAAAEASHGATASSLPAPTYRIHTNSLFPSQRRHLEETRHTSPELRPSTSHCRSPMATLGLQNGRKAITVTHVALDHTCEAMPSLDAPAPCTSQCGTRTQLAVGATSRCLAPAHTYLHSDARHLCTSAHGTTVLAASHLARHSGAA